MSEQHAPDLELAETFAEVARVLLDENDVERTLERICQLAVKTIDGCQAAGVSIKERNRVTSRSTSDNLPGVVDQIQSETQEGPCVDAIVEHEVFLTGSLPDEARWPKFAQRAHAETGVSSILSLRLYASDDTMGALNLYSTARDAFDDQDVAIGTVFAAHAAVALAGARKEASLETMAAGREVVGMAMGILMARKGVSEAEAFDLLRRASQRMNVKLREVAARVVHPLPDDLLGGGDQAPVL